MDFCEEGSKECTSATSGGSAGSAGTSGNGGKGGTSGTSGGSGNTSGSGGSTGASGDGGGGGSATACDVSALADGCVVMDSGIFVAPTGDDANDGLDKNAPVKTIAKGVELAAANNLPLFVCNDTYDESVALTDANDGLVVYGGFSCPAVQTSGWDYVADTRAVIAPSAVGYALHIDGASGVSISDVEFRAADGVDPGDSSIAAFIAQSANIALTRVKLVAGKGISGDNGVLDPYAAGVAGQWPNIDDLTGNAAVSMEGGASKTCTCPTGNTTGALGGDGDSTTPTGGGNGSPDWPSTGGEGGTVTGDCTDGTGKKGEDGPNGDDGSGAAVLASFDQSGWTPRDGGSGIDGERGQGGGGGAGATDGGGGGGGCGACGGRGGPGGQAGGSSIGLLSFDSTLTLTTCEITTADAGNGGDGIGGQAGQEKSNVAHYGGGGGLQAGSACSGGRGGKGGAGGTGGGGAGGVSIGVVYSGTEPTGIDPELIMVGNAGVKGTGPASNDGLDGEAVATKSMP